MLFCPEHNAMMIGQRHYGLCVLSVELLGLTIQLFYEPPCLDSLCVRLPSPCRHTHGHRVSGKSPSAADHNEAKACRFFSRIRTFFPLLVIWVVIVKIYGLHKKMLAKLFHFKTKLPHYFSPICKSLGLAFP